MYLVRKISLIARACDNYLEKNKMTSPMTPSQRRRAYKLKRIVISEHNYLALKKLGQAGDSFNDVISNLLHIERNYQKEKERKQKLRGHQRLQRQQNSYQQEGRHNANDNDTGNITDEIYPSALIKDVVEHDNR